MTSSIAAPASQIPAVPADDRKLDAAHSSAPQQLVIAAGTRIQVRTASTLSTKTARNGDTVEAELSAPLVLGDRTLAARGSKVTLRIVESDDGGRVKGRARLAVRVVAINGVDARTSIYAVMARGTKKKDALKIGAAGGIGAAIGALAGGGKGAAIGAATGGGAGTGVVLATRGEPAVIAAESLLTFRLTAPLRLGW